MMQMYRRATKIINVPSLVFRAHGNAVTCDCLKAFLGSYPRSVRYYYISNWFKNLKYGIPVTPDVCLTEFESDDDFEDSDRLKSFSGTESQN